MNATFALLLTAAALAAPAPQAKPASKSAQLAALVADLQKSPSDDALRKKIIALANKVKPAPAVPTEARRHFVKGVTLQKDAKNAAELAPAIEEYRLALAEAPWWADAYFNMATAQETVGDFAGAKKNIELYLLSGPKDADAAQDRLFALEAKAEKANKENSPEARAAREKEVAQRFIASLEGAQYICRENETFFYTDGLPDKRDRLELEIRNGVLDGARVTTWLGPRVEVKGSNHVGFRASLWFPPTPLQGKVTVFIDNIKKMIRVEIYDDRLVLSQENWNDTCRRQ